MQFNEVSELHYLFRSNPLYQLQQIQELNPQSTTIFTTNSTSDEGDDQQLSIINEKKQRRMISNRESARRSRMRKQKHLNELWAQVIWLRNKNHQLIDELNQASERHDRVIEENSRLKDEALGLRQMLADMQINSPVVILRDQIDDDNPCNDYQFITNSL